MIRNLFSQTFIGAEDGAVSGFVFLSFLILTDFFVEVILTYRPKS
jgi:hypothetical protein